MATRDTLVFGGRAWPGARIDGPTRMLGVLCEFSYVISGNGREWLTDSPRAFWRTFATLDTTGPNESLRFLARHGDPLGGSEVRKSGSNAEWLGLQYALAGIAQAWIDPNDPDGVSYITDNQARLTAAADALYEAARPDKCGLSDIEWIAQGRGLVPRAKTLRAYMIASAASALEYGIPMRRCDYCADWFELRRTDALYCSGSCQAAGHKLKAAFDTLKASLPEATLKTAFAKLKGSSHGISASAHAPRQGHLSRGLARKRSRRKASPKK